MSGEIFSDSSMLEIFRAEVEAHVESLTSGLLALERDPGNTDRIDEMMRGAHSIKGAARIVGVDPAVRVAHVMEDGFIAAQNGKLTLRPEHVDILLRGVDFLTRVAHGTSDSQIDWKLFDAEATPLVAEITAVLSGTPAPKKTENVDAPPVTSPSSPAPSEVFSITIPVMLDASASEVARRSLIAGVDSGAKSLRLDLSATQDLDATGLALLAVAPSFVEKSQARIELLGVASDLRRVLDATGVLKLYAGGL